MKILKSKWYITECRITRRNDTRTVLLACGCFNGFWRAVANMPPQVPGIAYVPVRGDRILNNPNIYVLPAAVGQNLEEVIE